MSEIACFRKLRLVMSQRLPKNVVSLFQLDRNGAVLKAVADV